jgi:hypothetical protein
MIGVQQPGLYDELFAMDEKKLHERLAVLGLEDAVLAAVRRFAGMHEFSTEKQLLLVAIVMVMRAQTQHAELVRLYREKTLADANAEHGKPS